MSDTFLAVEVRVRYSGGTNLATARGFRASATCSPEWAARECAAKVLNALNKVAFKVTAKQLTVSAQAGEAFTVRLYLPVESEVAK